MVTLNQNSNDVREWAMWLNEKRFKDSVVVQLLS